MDVSIDTVSAQIQRETNDRPEPAGAPARQERPTETDQPELSFQTRRERLRARLSTF
jgi:hypothetical protein